MERMPIKDFAKYLIEHATASEMKLHRYLTKNKIKFKFQYIIEPFIVDFYFPKQKCIIELDSPRFHNKIKDASRDLYLNNAGYKVHRIKAYRCFKDMAKVSLEIDTFLKGNKPVRKKKSVS